MSRLDTFVSQLDGLVVFLAAAHDEVFQTIKRYELTWFPASQDPKLPETVGSYRVAVCNAGFLLGYAYFEAFLADVVREVYLRRPEMLSRNRQITFREVLGAASKDDIVRLMIEKEVRSIFSEGIEDVRDHFEQKLQISWPNLPEIIVASRMRNCLMHNGGLVDERLAAVCNRPIGSQIKLETNEVHGFGIKAREFAKTVWTEAERRHLGNAG